ncbi:MAG: SUF system NifU family Fe-S cluster assembly protein [Armatimonadetes bacterium JP3_11]|jgi:nitrogen fixation NifU-like protein|nr:MAG: SUF system NifU family Fe-S cluster assembly protein [Armatimonadetes bacterium CP1_7O]OYT71326.1 MAG: SUF system NifU family Fe-S cluster assembly protein [Armatimonadetes bacterium JP3_11]RMH09011.1 MAG: SUF system NifU family Fe-S cluster assembly protein [Armatimonadota bacterium]
MLDELYQDIILDHYRHPRGRGELEPPKITQEGFNPSCGDEVILDLRVQDGRIQEVRFHGRGCSISQASASMMTEAVKGKTLEEARALIQQVLALVKGETEGDIVTLGDIVALAGVRNFPVRVKCATLAWHTLEEALKQAETGSPTV